MLYLDTSVVVCALSNEPRTEAIQQWLAAQSPGVLAVSDWTVTEFSSALSMKVRMNSISTSERAEVLALFASLREESFCQLPLTSLDFMTAARYADQHASGLRAGDALHLAVAGNHGARLVTLDRQLREAAVSLGVTTAVGEGF